MLLTFANAAAPAAQIVSTDTSDAPAASLAEALARTAVATGDRDSFLTPNAALLTMRSFASRERAVLGAGKEAPGGLRNRAGLP